MAGALLTFDGVCKSYWRGPHELRVLNGLSLAVDAGELMVVWGRRGAGKTTLLRLAAGLESCDRGRVCFQGVDVASMSAAEHATAMRERIAWVRRGGPRSELRMIDYVALPLLPAHGHRSAYALAREALARVGVGDCAQQYWPSLSDGERALVGIARVLAREPRLVLVDDPTANLGLRERERLVALLRELADGGVGVLLTVPDMHEMMGAHQIRALSNGRIIAPPEPAPEHADNVIDFPSTERSA
jgi:ABC-type cobalamin/Fe3+-siderophores transport system ATPase subunit